MTSPVADTVSLLAYKGTLKIVGKCGCGKSHNPPSLEVRQATLEDIVAYIERKDLKNALLELLR